MMFGLGTFARGDDVFAGLVVDGVVHDLRPSLGDAVTTATLLAEWDKSLLELHDLAARIGGVAGTPLSQLRPLPPVAPAGQLFCAGANYYRHTVEMSEVVLRNRPGQTLSDEEIQREAIAIAERAAADSPFAFSAQPTSMCGANDDVILWGPGVEHDWELEIAVVIGREAHCISPENAMDHVAGYTICNDISTRDVMFRPGFALSDFMRSKDRPTFFPIGPYLVPREFVPDYRALRIQLSVNGEVMQDQVADDMLHGVEQLVAYVSNVAMLKPGDVVLTGSPAGNAAVHGNRWLRAGDVIAASIAGLGHQRNVCVRDPRATQ